LPAQLEDRVLAAEHGVDHPGEVVESSPLFAERCWSMNCPIPTFFGSNRAIAVIMQSRKIWRFIATPSLRSVSSRTRT